MSAADVQTVLDLGDGEAVADLRTFVSRARTVDPNGAIRLQAVGSVLATYVCVLRPRALGEATPTVLGMRALRLARPADVDTTVPMASVSDRLAHMGADDALLDVPSSSVHVAWAAVTPPRGPWTPVGTVSSEILSAAAAAGMGEVAAMVPEQPGAAVVDGVRAAVWGRDVEGVEGVPSGAAFAAEALGFLQAGEQLQLFMSGAWLRVSSPRGHILCKLPGAQRASLGAV